MITFPLPSASASYTFPIVVSVSTIGIKCLRTLPFTAILLNELCSKQILFLFYYIDGTGTTKELKKL